MSLISNIKVRKKNELLSEEQVPLWRKLINRYGTIALCMAIPALLMYLIYVAKAHYPFGEGSVLVLDLNAQYVWFFEALRNFAKGDASLLYSFSRSLGGEFLGIYAYYIASPLSYIVCLFPKERMLEALLTLFLLKTAICGGTFAYYMKKTEKDIGNFALIIFSCFYALSAYAVVQQHNTMWIDAVMWLPLVTLGIEQLIKHGKFKLYTIFLGITLISNYYIGYMVCIFCLIYFFLYYIAHNEDGRNNPMGEKRHFLKSFGRIAIFSLIAIGMAAVILLSAYYSLSFGKSTFSDPDWTVTLKFDILDLLYKFLPGAYDTVRPEGLPFVYCGLLTLLLLPAYFLSNKYPMRQKIVSGIFVFILIASFSLSVIDLAWHGFQFPNWLNYRYSFILIFYLCVLGCRAFGDFENISLRGVMGTAGLIALLCVILQKYESGTDVQPDDYTNIWFTLVMIFAYLALLGLLRKTTDKQLIGIFLTAAVGIEVFLSGLWNLNGLDYDVVYTDYTSYNGFLDETRPIVDMVQEQDDSFYRMEKIIGDRTNDNMALKIRGLTGSTSTLNEETIRFLNKLGYNSQSHWSSYIGGNPVNDSLLGIKYVLGEVDSTHKNYYETAAVDTANLHVAYKNPYALSIAYGVSDKALTFPLGFREQIEDESIDADEDENAVAGAVDALKKKINEILGIEETSSRVEYVDDYSSPMDRLNAIVTALLGEEETVEVFVPIKIEETIAGKDSFVIYYPVAGHKGYGPDPSYSDEEAYIAYKFTMPETAELFFYLPSDYPRQVEMVLYENNLSENLGYFYGEGPSSIISMGYFEKDAQLRLNLKLCDDNLYIKNNVNTFYYIDWDVFEDVMGRLGQDQYNVTEYGEDFFRGTFTASREHELVMTTIPYDRGWRVYVDGEEVEISKALGSLVSFYIDGEAGQTHDVELVYRPNTFVVGLSVTLISAGLLILIIIFEKKLKKIPVVRTLVGVPRQTEITTETTVTGDPPASDQEATETDPQSQVEDPPAEGSASPDDYADPADKPAK